MNNFYYRVNPEFKVKTYGAADIRVDPTRNMMNTVIKSTR